VVQGHVGNAVGTGSLVGCCSTHCTLNFSRCDVRTLNASVNGFNNCPRVGIDAFHVLEILGVDRLGSLSLLPIESLSLRVARQTPSDSNSTLDCHFVCWVLSCPRISHQPYSLVSSLLTISNLSSTSLQQSISSRFGMLLRVHTNENVQKLSTVL
jgi:hypothetical protein